MPMHDWTRVSVGIYHNFLQCWTISLNRQLNDGLLPQHFYGMVALPEPPAFKESDAAVYARKANRLHIHNNDDRVVAVIEIVSPGNKDNRHGVRSFVGKAVEFLTQGVNLLLVDPFPPTNPAPDGLHLAIWGEVSEAPFGPNPAGQPLTAAAFDATVSAYLEPFAVGDPVPTMPLFLGPGWYVNVPLEESYRAAWESLPRILQDRVRPPA